MASADFCSGIDVAGASVLYFKKEFSIIDCCESLPFVENIMEMKTKLALSIVGLLLAAIYCCF
jgi:hypothetical protein